MVYETQMDKDGKWRCNCAHKPKHPNDPCRHILQKQIDVMLEHIADKRDERDNQCDTIGEVTERQHQKREKDMEKLTAIMMLIAKNKEQITTDDLHLYTNERYYGDRIVGSVIHSLLQAGMIEQIGRKNTVRKCAHGRSIGVYRLKPEEKKVLGDMIPNSWMPPEPNKICVLSKTR
jgi:hypothetical protein